MTIPPRREGDGTRVEVDVTASRNAHVDLLQAGGLLRAISEATSDNIFAKDVNGRYLFLNRAAAALMGKSAAEVIGHDDSFLFGPEDAIAVAANDQEVMTTNRTQTVEQNLAVAGVTRTYLTTKSPYRDEAGQVVGVLGIARDISDRIEERQALLVRKNLFAMLSRTNRAVSQSTSPVELYREVCRIASETSQFYIAWIGEAEGDHLRVIAAAGNDLSYMNGLVISLDPSDPRSQGPAGQAFLTGEIVILNNFMSSPIGKPWYEAAARIGLGASAAFPLKEQGKVVAVLILYATDPNFYSDEVVRILSEITPSMSFALDRFLQEKARAEGQDKLARSQALLRVASRIARMGAWAVDLGALKVTWSDELLAILELEPDHSPDFEYGINIYLPAYRDGVLRAFTACAKEGVPFDLEVQASTETGRTLWVRIIGEAVREPDGTIVGVHGAFEDIGERRKLEDQLRQVQKMEAIGQLAGGIAHDFNNLLTVINVCSEDVLEQLGKGHPLTELVTEIHQAGVRAGTLTRQLLTFSRQQVLDIQVIDVNEVVARVEKMLRRLIGENVELVTAFCLTTCNVRADAGQLEQVLMNLSVNARDAMPRGGRLTIQTGEVHLEEADTEAFGDLGAGEYVRLTVSDTGVGMSAEVRERIFEPFFTTRGVGQGTGLGLATVHGIVRQSGGQIVVYSEPGIGTTFKIYLPKVLDPSPAAQSLLGNRALPSGTETILLVEDEQLVRALAGRVLRKCGYEVLEAVDGKAALELLAAESRRVDLLVTDVVMPRMGGPELAQILKASRPECAVLLVSGYADGASIREGVIEGGYAFLQKPFSMASLAQKVRAVLDSAAQ